MGFTTDTWSEYHGDWFRNVSASYPPRGEYYAGLSTNTSIGFWVSSSPTGEPSVANGYQRIHVGYSNTAAPYKYTTWNSIIYNYMEWQWPACINADWGTIYTVHFYNNIVGSGYIRYFYAVLDTPVYVAVGDTFTIPQNGLQLRLSPVYNWLSL